MLGSYLVLISHFFEFLSVSKLPKSPNIYFMRKTMLRRNSLIFTLFILQGCGGGNASIQPSVTPIAPAQALVGSNGDLSKYIGSWSSCTAEADGSYYGKSLVFSYRDGNLVFTPSIGFVGNFSDSACTLGIPGRVSGVSPIVPQPTGPITTNNFSARAQFSGQFDQISNFAASFTAFQFAAFSTDYKNVWFASTDSFTGTAVQYHKN